MIIPCRRNEWGEKSSKEEDPGQVVEGKYLEIGSYIHQNWPTILYKGGHSCSRICWSAIWTSGWSSLLLNQNFILNSECPWRSYLLNILWVVHHWNSFIALHFPNAPYGTKSDVHIRLTHVYLWNLSISSPLSFFLFVPSVLLLAVLFCFYFYFLLFSLLFYISW